jgi:KaiC/GvpD/RAD55 family RecA-like ATPase
MPERLSTGIEGLDKIIQGGFPKGTVNLVSGPAGSGKTLLGLHFFHGGATVQGENSMYLSLEEPRANLDKVLGTFGMEMAPFESMGKLVLLDLGELRVADKNAGPMLGFGELQDFLRSSLRKNSVERLVIDSLSAIGLHYRSMRDLREELFLFVRFLHETNVTALMITESLENAGLTRWGFEQFVADSFIHLGMEETKGELRRTITIRKMRFTKHDTVKHPLRITQTGIVVEADERVV